MDECYTTEADASRGLVSLRDRLRSDLYAEHLVGRCDDYVAWVIASFI